MLVSMLLSSFDVNYWANIAKGYALAIGVVFAISIAWTWWAGKLRQDKIELQVRAQQAYGSLTQLVMQCPEVAIPVADGGPLAERYHSFMQLLLATADQILLLDPSPEWHAVLTSQLAPHLAYLESAAFRDGFAGVLSPATRRLIEAAIAGRRPAPA